MDWNRDTQQESIELGWYEVWETAFCSKGLFTLCKICRSVV